MERIEKLELRLPQNIDYLIGKVPIGWCLEKWYKGHVLVDEFGVVIAEIYRDDLAEVLLSVPEMFRILGILLEDSRADKSRTKSELLAEIDKLSAMLDEFRESADDY